jgi:hypothetical protein
MPATLLSVDFHLFPDNHVMPSQFTLGGLAFSAIDPAARLFVNDTAGDRGLQFETSGLRIDLPGVANAVLMLIGGFAGPVEARAFGVAGNLLRAQTVLPPNQYVQVLLQAVGMVRVELTNGGAEGILAGIVVPVCT